tara:strand:+ start:1063 stop:1947 length:885 start_codon:yes stop_codon:yes gene_type:complete
MIKPIFSIIIPTYNSLKTLDKTIRSVLNQTFKYYEIIVVDDGSTDNTCRKLKDYKDTRIKLFKIERSGGPAKPRNFGISKSNSNWICFLDSDDLWEKNKLSTLFKYIKKKKFDVLCHNEFLKKRNNIKVSKYGPFKKNFYNHLLINGNLLSTSATMLNKNFLIKNNLKFNESRNFVSVEDYDLWMMLAKKEAIFLFIDDTLGTYLIHNHGISQNNFKHLNNLRKLFFHHVFKIQKFENDKKALWKYLEKKVDILLIINNFRKKPFNFNLTIKLFFFLLFNLIFIIKFYKRKFLT